MSALAEVRPSAEEYLAQERRAEFKSERVDGEIYAMAGASERHVTLVTNLVVSLGSQFKQRPCKVYSSDLRLNINAQGNYLYPDVVALCGEPRFDDRHRDNLLNPTVIIEILSGSTETYDRGRKAELYRQLDSVQEYLLVAQDRCHVEHYRRQPGNTWLLRESGDPDAVLELSSLGCQLALRDVYDKIEWSGSAEL